MWKPLYAPYFITFAEEKQDYYYIGVTDFRRHWVSQTSSASLLYELKETNDGLEFDDEKELLQRGLDMIKHPKELQKIKVTEVDNGAVLNVSMSKMYEITLRMELGLLQASPNHFFETVIQPLLKSVCDLRSSQNELRQLLIKKDKEIEEYKIEGKAPRRLITTLYDDATHMSKHTTFDEFFGAHKVPETFESMANSSTNSRKRPLSPEFEKKEVEIKKSSQDPVVEKSTTTNAEETKIETPEFKEVKPQKQKKRLNY